MRHLRAATSLGDLLLVADGVELVGLYFPGHTYPPGEVGREVGRKEIDDDPVLADATRQLREYLAGERRGFDLPVGLRGDDFSRSVWNRLRLIPYGETVTYGQIARELGNPGLAQRVGQAVGHNPVSIVVPCHRVVGSNGSLTGFAGGLERKRTLLDLEAMTLF